MVLKKILKTLRLNSIRSQLIVGIAIVNVALMSLFVMEQMNRQKTFFLKENHDRAAGLSINLANTADSYVISLELARLQKLVSTYKEIPNLEYAIVTSDDGVVLAHTNEKFLGLKAADPISAKLKQVNTTQVLLEDNNLLDIATPIVNHKEIVGWARIGVSQKYIEPHIAEIKRRGILYILISLVVGSLFAVIVAAGLSRGLQKLVTTTEKIKAGNRNVRATPSDSEEITQLGNAFNQMLDHISSNEKLLGMVLENMPVGVFILDEKGKVLSANPAAQQIWEGAKYVGKDEYNVYKGWFPNGKEIESHEWGAAVALNENRAVLNQEAEIEGFDGNRKTILNSCIPMQDADKKILGVISINVDITEWKKAETKIKERESQLTTLFDNMEGATSLLDTEKKYVLFNKRFIQDHHLLSGHDPYVGQLVYDFLPPDLLEKRLKLLDNVLKGNKEVIEADHLRNGKRVYYRSSFSPVIADGKVIGISTYSIDLTKSKEAEMKIRESEEKLGLFIEHSPASLAMFDTEMRYIATSRRWMNDYNLGQQNIIGKTHYEIFPEIGQEWKDIHQRCLKGAIERREEDSFTRLDGTTDWLRWEIHPWHKSSGEIGGIIMFTEVITDRKNAEIKLEQSEEKNRALVENISDAIVLMDANSNVIYQSPSAEHITGYSFEDRTSETYEFVYKEDQPKVIEVVQKAMSEPGVPIHYQLRINHKEGHIIWIDATILNLLHNESIKAVVITYSDITERKKATEMFKHQFENSPDIILIINRDMKIESLNRGRQGGPGPKEHIGINAIDTLPADSKEVSRNAILKCFDTGLNQEIENKISGNRYVRSRFVPITIDGAITHIMIIATDITEQKKAEQELQQSEERNRALIENISDTIILVNEKLEVVYQSPSFIRTAGLTLSEHKGKTVLNVLHPDELDKSLEIINQSKSFPNQAIPFQMRTLHKNGHYIWVEGTVTNLLQNESVKAFVLNYRDITDRKNAQDEMKEMNERLRLLSSHLQNIREEERTSMAREIHDELGQQLTGIKMDAMAIKRKSEVKFPEAAQKAEEMMKLVDVTIKTVRRIATELRPGVLDDLGLAAAIEWQANEFEKRTGIKCMVDTDEADDEYSKDINTTVFRIFQESLTNVARHAEANNVMAKLSKDSNTLVLEIKDDGKGITEERKNNKTSLGLLGMKERAAILRGDFSIQNLPVKGTAVTLKIPLS